MDVSSSGDTGFLVTPICITLYVRVSFEDTRQSAKFVNMNGDLWGRISVEWTHSYVDVCTFRGHALDVRIVPSNGPFRGQRYAIHAVRTQPCWRIRLKLERFHVGRCEFPAASSWSILAWFWYVMIATTLKSAYRKSRRISSVSLCLSSTEDLRIYSLTVTPATLARVLPFARATYCHWMTHSS